MSDKNKFVSSDTEATLREHIAKLNAQGRNIPTAVEEIAEFPYKSFDELVEALKNKEALLLRFAFDYLPQVAQTLNPTPMWTINLLIAYVLPILSVILAIFYSWWCILGLAFFFIGLSRNKKLYNDTIFRAAMTNELAFCYLFFARQISVSNPDRSFQYFYDSKKSATSKV